MSFRTTTALLALSLAAPGCAARAIDLDIPPAIESSAEPGVLGIIRETVQSLAVDDQRLYWVGYTGASMFVQSCQKQDCAATFVTYDAQPFIHDTFAVRGGQVYWYRRGHELMACPIAGCSGLPRSLASELYMDNIVFDDDRLYFTDANDWSSLYSVPLTQPGSRQISAFAPSGFARVAVDDGYVYWLTREMDQHETALFRTRKDGTSAVEAMAHDVKLSYKGFGITTDPSSIYWTNNVLVGSINRCPLAGCSGTSEVVVGPLRAPRRLLIDGSDLYYVYEAQPYEYALATCSLPACAQSSRLFEKLVAPSALAMDDQYLYLATTEQDVSPYADINRTARIRRLRKPNRGLP